MYLFVQHIFLLEGLYVSDIILGTRGKAINMVPTIKEYKVFEMGHLGGLVSKVSAFSSGHDLRVLGLSSTSGSLLSGESASLSPSLCLFFLSLSLSLSLSQINKINI